MHESRQSFTITNGDTAITAWSVEPLRQHLRQMASGRNRCLLIISRDDRLAPADTYCRARFDGAGRWDVEHRPGHSGRHYHMEVAGPAAAFHIMCQWLDGSPGFFGHDWSQTRPLSTGPATGVHE